MKSEDEARLQCLDEISDQLDREMAKGQSSPDLSTQTEAVGGAVGRAKQAVKESGLCKDFSAIIACDVGVGHTRCGFLAVPKSAPKTGRDL